MLKSAKNTSWTWSRSHWACAALGLLSEHARVSCCGRIADDRPMSTLSDWPIYLCHFAKGGRSERDKLGRRRSAKFIIPPCSDARPVMMLCGIIYTVSQKKQVIKRCYVNRQINVSYLTRNINCCRPVFTTSCITVCFTYCLTLKEFWQSVSIWWLFYCLGLGTIVVFGANYE